jgi:hypothetical protein
MTPSIRSRHSQQGYQRRYESSPDPSSKEPTKSGMDLNAEIRALELDISNNPFPESTRPRQPPATTRYHGKAPKQCKPPREKRRHPKSWRKRKAPTSLTDPKTSLPQTNLGDDPPSLTNHSDTHLTNPRDTHLNNPGDTHITNPKVPSTRSRPEPRAQPEVIDLTGED